MKRLSYISILTIALAGTFAVTSCRHDPITPLSDAPAISFQNDVQPIIISNCTESGCHGESEGRGGLRLTSYDEVMKRVSAGNPHASKLYGSITANTMNTMPKPPNPRLSDTQIKTIYLWILQGAKNN